MNVRFQRLEQGQTAWIDHTPDGHRGAATHLGMGGGDEPRERRLIKSTKVLKPEQLRNGRHLVGAQRRTRLLRRHMTGTNNRHRRQDQRDSNHQNLG